MSRGSHKKRGDHQHGHVLEKCQDRGLLRTENILGSCDCRLWNNNIQDLITGQMSVWEKMMEPAAPRSSVYRNIAIRK